MPTVADYDVVIDDAVPISPGTPKDFPIGVESAISTGTRSVLSYMVDPGPSGVEYSITIFPGVVTNQPGQGTGIEKRKLAAQAGHVRHEVVGPGVLRTPDNDSDTVDNLVRIDVSSGEAVFSDIVLMYQRTV